MPRLPKRPGTKYSLTFVNLFHNKIMSFGGGFYGTMAVLTYALIEIVEVWVFLVGLVDPDTWINKLGPGLFIDFFVNSLINLIAAFIWFGTLPDYIAINAGFIWLAAAYGGYLADAVYHLLHTLEER